MRSHQRLLLRVSLAVSVPRGRPNAEQLILGVIRFGWEEVGYAHFWMGVALIWVYDTHFQVYDALGFPGLVDMASWVRVVHVSGSQC
jgi:hypothetical protein